MERPPSRRGWVSTDVDVFDDTPPSSSPRRPLGAARTVTTPPSSPPESKTALRPGTPTPTPTASSTSPGHKRANYRPRGPRPTTPRTRAPDELVCRASQLCLDDSTPAQQRRNTSLLPALDLNGRDAWSATSTLQALPSSSGASDLAAETLTVVIAWLGTTASPPFPLGPRAANEARGALAQLMPLSSDVVGLVRRALYADLVVRASGLRSLLRALLPPIPTKRRGPRKARDDEEDAVAEAGAQARADAARAAVSRVFIGSLAPVAEAGYLVPPSPNPRPPLTAARAVAIGARAWQILGTSTLAATTVARLASPSSLCVHLGAGEASAAGTLTLAAWILPAWPDLDTITFHSAHELRFPRASVPLFRKDTTYRLVFRGATWDAMAETVRALLNEGGGGQGAYRGVPDGMTIEVVLPFDAHGSLPPPPQTKAQRRKPVPSYRPDARDPAPRPPKSPLRPTASLTALSPARTLPRPTPKDPQTKLKSGLKPTASAGTVDTTRSPQSPAATGPPGAAVGASIIPPGTHSVKTLADAAPDLPAIARRLVLRGRAAPVTFVTVETLLRDEHGCATCSAPWLA